MKTLRNASKSFEWILYTVGFIKQHFWLILGLGLVAAVGRTIQLLAFGPISPFFHMLLEVLIESARVALVLYALGLANMQSGLAKISRVARSKATRHKNWRLALLTIRKRWVIILMNLGAFLLLAYGFNALIDHIAYQTCLYITLTRRQLISEQSSEWVLILFLKNISIIPFTLVFQTLFLIWITNRLPSSHLIRLDSDQ
ncbi:hypothetical protein [Spirosoma pulveris]